MTFVYCSAIYSNETKFINEKLLFTKFIHEYVLIHIRNIIMRNTVKKTHSVKTRHIVTVGTAVTSLR